MEVWHEEMRSQLQSTHIHTYYKMQKLRLGCLYVAGHTLTSEVIATVNCKEHRLSQIKL